MQKHYLSEVIEPVVNELGFNVIRILTIGETNPTLQIMIEHIDYTKEITVDDCTTVSKALSVVLDEKDPIENKYTLEVSSPGIDRPLTKIEHFKRYLGYLVKVETIDAVEKRKRFKGTIESISDNADIVIKMEDTEYLIAFENISKAKIILTDELWEQYLKSHKNTQN